MLLCTEKLVQLDLSVFVLYDMYICTNSCWALMNIDECVNWHSITECHDCLVFSLVASRVLCKVELSNTVICTPGCRPLDCLVWCELIVEVIDCRIIVILCYSQTLRIRWLYEAHWLGMFYGYLPLYVTRCMTLCTVTSTVVLSITTLFCVVCQRNVMRMLLECNEPVFSGAF